MEARTCLKERCFAKQAGILFSVSVFFAPPYGLGAFRVQCRDVIEPELELVGSQARTLFCQPALTRNPHSGSRA